MEGRSSTRVLLFACAALILLSSIAATAVVRRDKAELKVPDTSIRARLRRLKGARLSAPVTVKNTSYSTVIYDLKLKEDFSGRPPWVDDVIKDPAGGFVFTWRIKVPFASTFSIHTKNTQGDFTLRLIDETGAPLYTKTPFATLPSDSIELGPGLYVLKASAGVPLDFFTVDFIRRSGYKGGGDRGKGLENLLTVRLRMDRFSVSGLERMVKTALASTDNAVIKMPGGRVKAEILDEEGGRLCDVKVGLSGRTREHLEGFPSLDIKVKGDGSFRGLKSFKLYRLATKSGLLDMTFLSVLRDMGFFVPRQDVVWLVVNGKRVGLFVLMETPSTALFAAQKTLEGNILGLNTKKLFFDYPYGGELDTKYFYKLRGPYSEKKDIRFFASQDFPLKLDAHAFARYMAFASLYYSGHGLGVDDLRFYENPATGLFTPIPRDLNPGAWSLNLQEPARSYLTHAAWHPHTPFYTIWPVRMLLRGAYRFDRTKDVFFNVRNDHIAIGFTDLHFAIPSFLSTAGNMELANRYMKYFAENRALYEKLKARLLNVLSEAVEEDYGNGLLKAQFRTCSRYGAPFLKEFKEAPIPERGLYINDGKDTYYWNVRTALSLKKNLMPSMTAPVPVAFNGNYNKSLFNAFMLERRIFSLLESSGIRTLKKSFERIDPAAVKENKNILRPPKPPSKKKNTYGKRNVVIHLGTFLTDNGDTLLLFLVRNATKSLSQVRIVQRDGISSYEPDVNILFRLDEKAPEEYATDEDIMTNRFHEGEPLRLIAFRIRTPARPVFYKMDLPKDALFYFPPYMYIPPRPKNFHPDRKSGFRYTGLTESKEGFHIPQGTVLNVERDLILPPGRALYIHKGATVRISPGRSIMVRGDLYILGTKEEPVRFVPEEGATWGGLFAAGSPFKEINVVVRNAEFSEYGSFPKTKVGDLYLNGGLTFYRAKVRLDGVSIRNANGEDALNLISSIAKIRDTNVTGTFSDGIDFDFTDADIEHLTISGTKGDGLDVSNSLVVVEGSRFYGAADKGISVGEMSRVFVKDSVFSNNDMGIANKDQSFLSVKGSIFENNRVAVAEFIKKPYFGRPHSILSANNYKDNKHKYQWLGLFRY